MIKPKAHIAALSAYALADMTVAPGKRLISLAQNESAVPPSPLAIRAGREALGAARFYSDPDWVDLPDAIAEAHDIPPEQILCGAGSMELIACLIRCFAGPGDSVLSSQYGYAFFRTAALAAGAAYDSAPEHDMTLSVDALLAAARDETRIVCIANPGNPTGTRIGRDDIVRLRDGLEDDILLVIDEAYGEFSGAPDEATFGLAARGNTVILRTFSKAYGLAGLRVGWGLFPPDVAFEMRKLLNPNNISVSSLAAASAAMKDQAYMCATRDETIERRDRFARRVRGLGLSVSDSSTNFVLIRFPDTEAAQAADRALRAEGILLRAMAGYGLPNCLRATIGSEEDMEAAAAQLARLTTRGESQC